MTRRAAASVPTGVPADAVGRPAQPPLTWSRAVGWIVLLAAFAFTVWAVVGYAAASPAPAPARAANPAAVQARTAALAAGTRELAELNSASPKSLPVWQRRWLADTVGAEHTEIADTATAAAAQIRQVKTTAYGSVTDAALTALNPAAGSAVLIGTVEVRQVTASGTSNTIRNRYRATLTRTPSGWKISALTGG